MTTISEIVKILTDSGIEPDEANVEVKMLIEHFAHYGTKDIIMGEKAFSPKSLKQSKKRAELIKGKNKTACSAI